MEADRIDRSVLMDPRADAGRATYEWLQELEERMSSIFTEHTLDFDIEVTPLIGFTAPWEDFVRANPDNVTIFRLEANTERCEELVPAELEVRFAPEDVRIVDEIAVDSP